MSEREIVVAHGSDLHIGGGQTIDEFHPLCRVLDTARAVSADVLLLAGDIFDHNRLSLAILDRASRLLDDLAIPVVILPGNHDCLTTDSVYRRGGIQDVPGVTVIGVEAESLTLDGLDLQVWGKAHFDYKNMSPLSDPVERGACWQIAMAHGHYLAEPADKHRGWLFDDRDLESTRADYVALGHWPGATAVGNGTVPAYYCGSPDLARTINVVRMKDGGTVDVRRHSLSVAGNGASTVP